MYLLGYDIGSSSVKASLVDAQSGRCVASSFYPKSEAAIIAVRPGWAEQDPASWWDYLKSATADVLSASSADPKYIEAIGISYQMHGLVCVDKDQNVLRPSIIWCDSRAVPYGNDAFDAIGHAFTYGLYGVICIIAAIFVWKLVPETKGKTLEDMSRLWKRK